MAVIAYDAELPRNLLPTIRCSFAFLVYLILKVFFFLFCTHMHAIFAYEVVFHRTILNYITKIWNNIIEAHFMRVTAFILIEFF